MMEDAFAFHRKSWEDEAPAEPNLRQIVRWANRQVGKRLGSPEVRPPINQKRQMNSALILLYHQPLAKANSMIVNDPIKTKSCYGFKSVAGDANLKIPCYGF